MRILICSDGSKWATKSARFVLQLFRSTAHEITILVFKQRAEELNRSDEAITRGTQEKQDNIGAGRSADVIEEEVQDLVDELVVDTAEINWLREEGDMAEHILDIADNYDLVCLGGAGKGGFSQHMLGLIADKVVTQGHGNLLVTKQSDAICNDILITLTHESVKDDDLAHYLGRLFEGSGSNVTVNVLWKDKPKRFEGYLDASTKRRLKQMVDDNLFPGDHDALDHFVEILESYALKCRATVENYESLGKLIEDVKTGTYDLLVTHLSPESSSFLQQVEPKKQSLKLMRQSASNVMLLRSIPKHLPED